jgi:spore coat polysaccharide biosynthesis protein SpsF
MILGILQARTSSTRMPGKVMAPILHEPMIWRQIERIRRARTLDRLVVATSEEASDDGLAAFLLGRGISVYRGDLHDVLGRFAACAEAWSPGHVVRLTADCPLTDPAVIDAVVGLALKARAAYASNCEPRTYPDGLDVEVMTAEALAVAAREAYNPADREHVTPFIRRDPQRFPQAGLVQAEDRGALRWTVDRPEDFAFVRAVFEALCTDDPGFGMDDVLELVDRRPDIAALSALSLLAAAA